MHYLGVTVRAVSNVVGYSVVLSRYDSSFMMSDQNKLWKLAFKLCMINHQTRMLHIAAFHAVTSQMLWEL